MNKFGSISSPYFPPALPICSMNKIIWGGGDKLSQKEQSALIHQALSYRKLFVTKVSMSESEKKANGTSIKISALPGS